MVAETIQELDLRERTVGIAPVGCAVLAYEYFNCDMFEAAHGRAPAVATGAKRARPDLIVFTGDALFAGSIGRTDFPGSSMDRLLANIREHLFALPEETAVYSGHGPPTTIGEERETNPWIQEDDDE